MKACLRGNRNLKVSMCPRLFSVLKSCVVSLLLFIFRFVLLGVCLLSSLGFVWPLKSPSVMILWPLSFLAYKCFSVHVAKSFLSFALPAGEYTPMMLTVCLPLNFKSMQIPLPGKYSVFVLCIAMFFFI